MRSRTCSFKTKVMCCSLIGKRTLETLCHSIHNIGNISDHQAESWMKTWRLPFSCLFSAGFAVGASLQGEFRWTNSNAMFRGFSCDKTTSKE
jgi:hypothetical protein